MTPGIPVRHFFTFLLTAFFSSLSYGQLQCDNDTTGLKSLIDLKFGTYLGFQGGLYPDGFNMMPFTHYAGGMNASRRVLPRNAAGEVDWLTGEVGFISMGASTAGNAFNHFKTVAASDPTVNQCLKIVNCTVGAKGVEVMIDTALAAWYWDDYIYPDLDSANLTAAQVQVIWVMVTSRVDTILYWPFQPRQVADKYEILMGVLLDKFPNLQMVFVSGFPYGGYADPTKEFYEMIAEPSSYWNNWTVKWLIERQIDGDLDLKYTNPGRKSPWIGWGPHLWADGMRPNFTDGLSWNCLVDFKIDGGGYHLSNTGKEKEGELLMDFFSESVIAGSWFNHNTRWESCDSVFRDAGTGIETELKLNIFPNPSKGKCYFELEHLHAGTAEVLITNTIGQTIFRKQFAIPTDYFISEIDMTGRPPGLYHVLAVCGNKTISKGFIIQ